MSTAEEFDPPQRSVRDARCSLERSLAVLAHAKRHAPGVYTKSSILVGLGDRVALQPGCVIGSDGFGYALDLAGDGRGPRHFKVPQAGNVVVEDDVAATVTSGAPRSRRWPSARTTSTTCA